MTRVRNGRPGNQIMMERTENRRWPDKLGLGPAQQIEPRRVGQNSSAQVGQNSWTQPSKLRNRLSIYASRPLVGLHLLEGFPDFPLRNVERLCLVHRAPPVIGWLW